MTALQTAMKNVSDSESTDLIPDRPRPPAPQVDTAAIAHAMKLEDDAFDDTHWVIQRSIARGGRDASLPRPEDSAAFRAVYSVLLGIQRAE